MRGMISSFTSIAAFAPVSSLFSLLTLALVLSYTYARTHTVEYTQMYNLHISSFIVIILLLVSSLQKTWDAFLDYKRRRGDGKIRVATRSRQSTIRQFYCGRSKTFRFIAKLGNQSSPMNSSIGERSPST